LLHPTQGHGQGTVLAGRKADQGNPMA
jgi:hypothetical protein